MVKSLFDDNTETPVNKNNNTQMSGAFFIKREDLIADIRLEFDAKHPLFNLYIDRLKKFVEECEDIHVLKSSSGI